jgi:glycosyltransferase involved in cell wall biosynthesis
VNPSTPRLSVVIPVHDNAATLDAQLAAVAAGAAGTPDVEVVVVDNRSSDASAAIGRTWTSRVPALRVVAADDQASEGYARNVGVAAARADSVAFCDGDDVVAPTWLPAMATALREHDFVTGPVELDLLNPPWLADVRGRGLFDRMPMLFGRVPFAHGCNFGVTRAALERAGGFRPDLPAGMDIEFSVRCWQHDVALAWVPNACVHYRHRVDRAARWRQARAYGRAQPALRALVPELVDASAQLEQSARRAAWLAKESVHLGDRARRAHWEFTLGMLVGDVSATVAEKLGR